MFVVLVCSLLAASTASAQLTLAQNLSGENFFPSFTFVTGTDNNTGGVFYQPEDFATANKLVSLNGPGNAVIRVDNFTNGAGDPNYGRSSVQMLSNATISSGSLLIMDALHIPFGCSVWPALWLKGANWPNQGEIDIIENVNLATVNQFSLHTLDGCQHPATSATSPSQETGTLISTDCFNQTNGNEGCIVQAANNSFGAGFAQNGGGVYAMLWDDTGIKLWFFDRSSVPADAASASPNPDNWPTPTAFYPQSSCNTTQFFGPQTMILQIDICGNFAGAPDVFNQQCQGLCTDLIQNPENYNDAFYEIAYIHVFTSASNASNGSTGGTSTGGPQPTGSGSSAGAGNPRARPRTGILSLTTIIALCFILYFS